MILHDVNRRNGLGANLDVSSVSRVGNGGVVTAAMEPAEQNATILKEVLVPVPLDREPDNE
ncbi:MAG: hypothetical protein HC801_12915 [Nitrospira sp.]|nr:hypothetical protein [Nitrospira sp.]